MITIATDVVTQSVLGWPLAGFDLCDLVTRPRPHVVRVPPTAAVGRPAGHGAPVRYAPGLPDYQPSQAPALVGCAVPFGEVIRVTVVPISW